MYIYNYVPFFEEIEENMSIKKGLNQRYKKDTDDILRVENYNK